MKVAILGATGMAGVEYVKLLDNHPWFKVTAVTGKRTVGLSYQDAVKSLINAPKSVADLEVIEPDPRRIDADLVFSALPSSAAKEVEPRFLEAGFPVVSEASAHRMLEDVPLVIPEVNPEHLRLIERQRYSRGGFIVTTPNCTTVGMVMALKPLMDEFGLKKVVVSTYQAVSGAGFPGVPSYLILGNLIPYIEREEEKVEAEARKLLGRLVDDRVIPADLIFEASCVRVPTIDGHLESIYIETSKPIDPEQAKLVLSNFVGEPQRLRLPTAPEKPIIVTDLRDRPQPRLDVMAGSVPGMSAVVGRIRPGRRGNSLKFFVLSHNRIRGAAGGAILTAELLYRMGYLKGG